MEVDWKGKGEGTERKNETVLLGSGVCKSARKILA